MVCNVLGSAPARLDPEDLREVMTLCHGCVSGVVERHGGSVGQYTANGFLGYFGYPQAHEEDSERAVRAGLEAIGAVGTLTIESLAVPLLPRVGIATGSAVLGGLPGNGIAQQEVVGEAVQVAGHLAGLAEPNTVVVEATTRRLIGSLFDCDDLGEVTRGNSEPTRTWRVLGTSAVDSRFEALRGASTPLVGREEELELLLRRWGNAASGEGRVVLVSGEAGIGKSRLIVALQEHLQLLPHARLRNHCSPHHQDSTLYPSIRQLERIAGFRRDDTGPQRLDKLEALLAQSGTTLDDAVPLIAGLLSLPTGDRYPLPSFSPQKRKEKTLQALLAQIEALAARQPVLMVFEDAHWADPTSLELLDLIIDRAPALAALLVISFRPDFAPPWIGRPHVTLLSLNRLSPGRSAEMIVGVTDGKALPKDIADQIIDRTDGVPLFIEELTKTVVESGLVVEAGDRYAAMGPVAPLAIPTTLQASLLARLDRLASTREVVQIAAALGRQFSHELISTVATMPQRQLENALAQLVDAELIFRRGTPPDAEYTFKHALVQDAAYTTLLRGRRRELHARIARSLEDDFADVAAAQPEVLARHCAEAGFIDNAITYYRKSGEQCVARSAIREAVAQFSKGLDQLSQLPEDRERHHVELELQSALGNVLFAVRGFAAPEPAQAYARVRELSELLGETTHLCRMMFSQWLLQANGAETRVAHQIAEELLRVGERRNEPTGLMMGHLAMAGTRLALGDFSHSRFHIDRLMDLNEPDLDSVLVQQIGTDARLGGWAWLPLDLFLLGSPDQAREQSMKVMDVARRRGHAPTLGWCLSAVCRFYALLGEKALFLNGVEEFTALAAAQEFPLWLAQASAYQGWAAVCAGNAEEGIALLKNGVSAYRATGALFWLPFLMSLLASGYHATGDAVSEAAALEEALALAERTGEVWFAPELHRLKGRLSSAEDPKAESELRCALDLARKQPSMLWQLRASTSLARLWLDQGKRTEARDLLAPVYGWFTEGFGTRDLKEAKALLDELT